MSVSVRVTHPTLGAYFDAHLLLKQCPTEQQRPAEVAGLCSLWRWVSAAVPAHTRLFRAPEGGGRGAVWQGRHRHPAIGWSHTNTHC
jgi:hypothetical protein